MENPFWCVPYTARLCFLNKHNKYKRIEAQITTLVPTINFVFPVCFGKEDFQGLYRLTANFLSILTPALLWRIPPRRNSRPWAMEWRRCTSCQGYGCKLLRIEAVASNHLIIYPGAGSTELAKRRGLPWSWVSFVQWWALFSNGRCVPWPPRRSVFHASR